MTSDLSFEDAVLVNLRKAAVAVFGCVFRRLPSEKQEKLAQLLADREASAIVSLCLDPLEMVIFVQPFNPTSDDETQVLCKIVWPGGAETTNEEGD